jgi:putative flippase GtrA
MPARHSAALGGQLLRYLINGLVATVVHYGVLRFNLEVLHMPLAGVANAIAAVFGIVVSFIGSRYFVFRATDRSVVKQGAVFLVVYGLIAVLHGLILYVWTDRMGLNYSLGFLLATGMQMTCSFLLNKFMVFR